MQQQSLTSPSSTGRASLSGGCIVGPNSWPLVDARSTLSSPPAAPSWSSTKSPSAVRFLAIFQSRFYRLHQGYEIICGNRRVSFALCVLCLSPVACRESHWRVSKQQDQKHTTNLRELRLSKSAYDLPCCCCRSPVAGATAFDTRVKMFGLPPPGFPRPRPSRAFTWIE